MKNTQVQISKVIYPANKWKELSLKPGLYHFIAYPFSTFRTPVKPHLCFANPTCWPLAEMFSVSVSHSADLTPSRCQGVSILVSAKGQLSISLQFLEISLPFSLLYMAWCSSGSFNTMERARPKMMWGKPIPENGYSYWEYGRTRKVTI